MVVWFDPREICLEETVAGTPVGVPAGRQWPWPRARARGHGLVGQEAGVSASQVKVVPLTPAMALPCAVFGAVGSIVTVKV